MSIGAIKKTDPSLTARGGAPRAATGQPAALDPAPESAPPRPEEYLGPARVAAAEGGKVTVELPGGDRPIPVEMALALPYEPVAGDTLLVIGRGDRHYAIGVLHGAGRTVLSLPGDVELHARDGSLSLSGDKGVAIRGPEIEVEAGKVRMVADSLVQKLHSVYQRVSGLLSVRAQEAHTVVDRTSLTKAKNATILTEETVTVNGKQILLG